MATYPHMDGSPDLPPDLTDDQRMCWLRLIRTDHVGPVTFRQLLNHFGSASAALEALPSLSARGGAKRARTIYSEAQAAKEFEAAQRVNARFVAIGERAYPRLLRHGDTPPPLLAVQGSGALAGQPTLAIVGARNASMVGKKLCAQFAAELAEGGYVIASGLARGIDAIAHRASLSCGTIAVLAGGLDKIYPAEHASLAAEIVAEGGMIVSEMPFGWTARARDFPRRNRLVAGMSLGVLVVEAAKRSGSLITARLANEMGREVFAIPGSPLDPRAEGTNHLIKHGATLVTEALDIDRALAPMLGKDAAPSFSFEEEAPELPSCQDLPDIGREAIHQALSPTPIAIDDIIRISGLSPAEVQLAIMELDLAGRLERHGGQRVSLIGAS